MEIEQGYGTGIGECNRLCPAANGHSLVTLFSLSVSVKDRPLHWILVRSQTYYSKHILLMGAGRLVALLSWVLALSEPTDWRRGWWRSKHHTKSGTQEWGLEV